MIGFLALLPVVFSSVNVGSMAVMSQNSVIAV